MSDERNESLNEVENNSIEDKEIKTNDIGSAEGISTDNIQAIDENTLEADAINDNNEPDVEMSGDTSDCSTFTQDAEQEPKKVKKPYSYRRSIAVALVGTVLCGSSLGFTLGLGLNTSNSILNGLSTISRAHFSFASDDKEQSADASDTEGTTENNNVVAASSSITTSNDDIVKVVNNTQDAVVNVNIKATTTGFFNQVYESSGSGSGIMFKQDDTKVYILTNNHVVEGASSCTISVTGSESVKASLVGRDASSDIAVISVLKSDLTAAGIKTPTLAKCGDSSKVEVGETVVAIGNSLGQGKTATVGIVSTTNKQVNIDGTKYTAIQTDAAINPGNSGGALVNTSGEVIGVNSAKTASTSIEGVGYAIPINKALEVANELMENGTSEKAYLGVSTATITDQFKQMYQIDVDGVLIGEVSSNSPAEEAGLQQTDIITAVDGTKVTTAEELSKLIKAHKPGDTVTLSIVRNGNQSMEVKATLTTLTQGF